MKHESVEDLHRCCDALSARVAELEADANRYRYLRDNAELSVRDVFGVWSKHLNDGLDAAIDAALLAKEGS